MNATELDNKPGSFSDADRAVLYAIMRSRRDVRQFRSTPIPPAVLRRVLEMAHLAPSVGFMQPWNFLLITSLAIREQVKALFEVTNAREQTRIENVERKALYATMKLEGILEAPLNIAVTCDHGRDAPFVLGRGPMPQTDLFSTCLAIQNLWLAARAEGIGVGWVSILDREATEKLLCLPKGVELVAYLCVGYPEEFRPKPLLEEVGWKHRQPLADLVYQDQWGAIAPLIVEE
jgi:5,6-dimethylbenzimidazole synthase